jgi:transcriptional regulator with XRE-family HTH domain
MSDKINLKEKVLQVLKLNNYSYAQLAEHIGLSEKELDKQFDDRTLEVRTLELISKALRIPLYSLFRDTNYKINYDETLYYNVDIWGKEGVELRTVLKKDPSGNIADGEIEKLRQELQEKERLLKELETKLNNK